MRPRADTGRSALASALVALLVGCALPSTALAGTQYLNEIVDADAAGVPGDDGGGGAMPGDADISATGRYVVFQMASTNLTPESDTSSHVYVKDMETGSIELVDRASGADGTVATSASEGRISDDGTRVLFASPDNGLSDDDVDGQTDLFIRDLTADTTELVSRADGASGAGADAPPRDWALAGSGRSVIFSSNAANLSDEDDDHPSGFFPTDVFVRDLDDDSTTLISRADGPDGEVGDRESTFTAISDDGRYAAFSSYATNLVADDTIYTDVFVRDLETSTNELVNRQSGAGGAFLVGAALGNISGNGRVVAFNACALINQPCAVHEVYTRDLDSKQTELVSQNQDGVPADTNSMYADLSGDGRYVTFVTPNGSGNLSPVVAPDQPEVYVRDRQAGVTRLATRSDGALGIEAGSSDVIPIAVRTPISDDGAFIAFITDDPDAVQPPPGGAQAHLYRRHMLGTPPDPEISSRVNVADSSGDVEVVVPGSPAPEPLIELSQIPVGSEIDTTDGTVTMTSDSGTRRAAADRAIDWYGGVFTVRQDAVAGAETEAVLSGPMDCAGGGELFESSVAERLTNPRVGRKVWGHGGGGHKSSGKKGSASVRGTRWMVADLCNGKTRIQVEEGVVEVRDFDRARTVSVAAGQLYDAPGPPDTTISSGPEGATRDRSPSFEFGSGEAAWGYECRIDDGAYAPCASPYRAGPLTDGRHTFAVRAADEAGSADVPAATSSFRVDTSVDGVALAADSPQRQRRSVKVVLTVSAGEAGTAEADGKISGGGLGRVKLETESTTLGADGAGRLRLAPRSKRDERTVLRALRRGRKARAEVSVRIEDEAGNAAERQERIRLVG